MANRDAPSGFTPIRYLSGVPYNGACNLYVIPSSDSTDTFVGDPVKLAGTGDTTGKYNGVVQAANGDRVVGVIVAMEPDYDDLSLLYRKQDTERYVWVADDPQLLFGIQEDSVGGALATGDCGNNADFIVGSGDTTSGASGVELDSSTATTTNTLDLKLLHLVNREDNELGTNAEWVVMFNKHQYADQIVGI